MKHSVPFPCVDHDCVSAKLSEALHVIYDKARVPQRRTQGVSIVTNTKIIKTLLFAAVAGLSATVASAATFTLQTSFDVAVRSGTNAPAGPDNAGLGGSRVTVTALFDSAAEFTRDGAASPRVVADSVTFTITGASNASSNGDFMANSTLGLFAVRDDGSKTQDGLFASTSKASLFPFNGVPLDGGAFAIGDLVNSVRLSTFGSVGTAAVGDELTLEIGRVHV